MGKKFHIGEQLRTLLDELKVSQTQLADLIGKQPSYVNRLLGYEFIRSDVIVLILNALEIPATYLFPMNLDKKPKFSDSSVLNKLRDKERIIELLDKVRELEAELAIYKSG